MSIKRRRRLRPYSRRTESALPLHVIMFSDRRRLRRWAAQVLLVWLFGLAMGVANACALGDQVHHTATATVSHDSPQHHHGSEQGDPAQVDCLDFCERSSIAAPQLKVAGDGLGTPGLALPPSGALSVPGLTEATVGRLVVDSPHLRGGPPPRIAYQRLAL